MTSKRQKLWKRLLSGFELGEATSRDVRDRLGEPAETHQDEKVTVYEYPAASAEKGAAPDGITDRFKKVQFIFYEDVLLNVSYVDPSPPVSRDEVHELLGEPDEIPEDDEEEGELSDIFEVDVDAEPMLSFAAHYDKEKRLEALSLCAEIEGDLSEVSDDEEE